MTVTGTITLVAYSRRRIPFDPIQMPFFDDVSQLLLDPRYDFRIALTQLLGGSQRRVRGADRFTIDHCEPVLRNLP